MAICLAGEESALGKPQVSNPIGAHLAVGEPLSSFLLLRQMCVTRPSTLSKLAERLSTAAYLHRARAAVRGVAPSTCAPAGAKAKLNSLRPP